MKCPLLKFARHILNSILIEIKRSIHILDRVIIVYVFAIIIDFDLRNKIVLIIKAVDIFTLPMTI